LARRSATVQVAGDPAHSTDWGARPALSRKKRGCSRKRDGVMIGSDKSILHFFPGDRNLFIAVLQLFYDVWRKSGGFKKKSDSEFFP